MDSWYSAKRLLKQIQSYPWHFVTRLKQNRKFKEKKLREHWPHLFGHCEGELVGGITVLVVKDGCRYLATSQTSLSVIEVKAIYAKRQQVEDFFKLTRGQLRWHQCPARSKRAQTAHLHLGRDGVSGAPGGIHPPTDFGLQITPEVISTGGANPTTSIRTL